MRTSFREYEVALCLEQKRIEEKIACVAHVRSHVEQVRDELARNKRLTNCGLFGNFSYTEGHDPVLVKLNALGEHLGIPLIRRSFLTSFREHIRERTMSEPIYCYLLNTPQAVLNHEFSALSSRDFYRTDEQRSLVVMSRSSGLLSLLPRFGYFSDTDAL